MTGAAHDLGLRGEAAAAHVAQQRGWRVQARRLRLRQGEADLYATRVRPGRSPDTEAAVCGLVVEVKAADRRWPAPDLVDRRRQARLWRVAEALATRDQLAEVAVVAAFVRLMPGREQVRWVPLEAW